MTNDEILEIVIESEDFGEPTTLHDYLRRLLSAVWQEAEGFCGKRPFGNSGWQYDVYAALIRNKVMPGDFDENGYVAETDTDAADRLIISLIDHVFTKRHTNGIDGPHPESQA